MAAGANSIFYGDTLLTTPNAGIGEDDALFAALAGRETIAPVAGSPSPDTQSP
jgi:biotin synthase